MGHAPVATRSIHPAIARMLLAIIQITNVAVAAELRRIVATVTRRRRSRARRVSPLSLHRKALTVSLTVL